MSKLIQMTDSSGNVYPITQFAELLWTNPSPSSSFSAQTITVDGSAYSKYMVLFILHTTNTNPANIAPPLIFGVGEKGTAMCPSGTSGATTGLLYLYGRVINASSATSVTFADNYVSQSGGTWAVNNSGLIPYQIYGIR